MINRRQHFRLHTQFDITWSVPDQKSEGDGIIFNISLQGMLFATDRHFEFEREQEMCFKAEQTPFFPSKGKLVWFKKISAQGGRYLCGVQFLNEASQAREWVQWMEENILKLGEAQNSAILERILSE
jgi:hypothetical protein